MTVASPSVLLPFVTSAPGKVILFGEHSAVYNKPAIAASVSSLRTYIYISKAEDADVICIDFSDINLLCQWKHSELSSIPKDVLHACFTNPSELNKELLEYLEGPLSKLNNPLSRQAAICFLYLYMCLSPDTKGVRFILKSTLPIGAGLGSSAAISVSLALAMSKLGGHIVPGSSTLTTEDMEFVNRWSLVGEKCIHGTPSGIDNAVATYGGAVLFRRECDGTTKFQSIEDFPEVPMILTNTKIPKSTKTLVAKVKTLVEKEPEIADNILEAMSNIALRAINILPTLDSNAEAYSNFLQLIRLNHGLLVSLGVSHPGLELIRSLSDTLNIGATKLTGAGGGGCALTILHKSTSDAESTAFKDTLQKQHGYESFTTDLGGVGCCFLPLDAIQPHMQKITSLFELPSTQQQLTDHLLPSSDSPLKWVHASN